MTDNNKNQSKDEIKEIALDLAKLSQMTRKELYELVRKFGLTNYSKMTKNELTFSILRKQTESIGYFFYEGILEILPDGYGFLRSIENSLLQGPDDVYISNSQIKRFNLYTGDVIAGQVRPPKEGEKFFALLRIEVINYRSPESAKDRISFENLTPEYPTKMINLEYKDCPKISKLMDIFSPIGFGQRGLIVAPPKAGKTTLLKEIANSIAVNHPETKIYILLVDERPEEVTDIKDTVNANVIAVPFDMDPKNQIKVAEMTLNLVKKQVEFGHDVVILMDSLTRFARAYNLYVPSSGKLLSGGVDPAALTFPKKFFGAARKIREGGSLTMLATALIETGSRMDEVIFEEFKGTGNMELILSREIANDRLFPAVNIKQSGTRKEELLLSEERIKDIFILRRLMNDMNPKDALEFIFGVMKKYKTNEEIFNAIENQKI